MNIQQSENLECFTLGRIITQFNLDKVDTDIEKALGILWNPHKDSLQIKVSKREVPLTKRRILSYTSSIFEMFGILNPVILEPKAIIQGLWKQNLNWDDEIPEELRNQFVKYKNNLKNWETLEIPCWYQINRNCDLELHIFADASTTSYDAVAYFQFREKGRYKCSFIMSESRLPSIKEKQLTVPRLELQAAVLAC